MNHELYHHGVIGMKWGIRRTKEQLGNAVRKASNNYPKQVTKNVTNQAAQKIARKTMGQDKDKRSGKEIAISIIKTAAVAAATTVLANAMTDVAEGLIDTGSIAAKNALYNIANGQGALANAAADFQNMRDLLKMDGLI